MSYVAGLKRSVVFKLCFAITFFTSGLVINFVQCVLWIFLRSWNKRWYRKINSYLCTTLYAQLVFLGDWWSGIDLVIYVDNDDFDKYWGKEHAYCIMNHTYEIDWLVLMMLTDRIQLLGNSKAYVKKALQYLPVLGWAWKLSDFIMLERSFEKDKAIISKQIKEIASYPDPAWLIVFPEGTRFTPDKHKASEDFARQRNLPALKHHLQPRTRGFVASLPSMRGKIAAIYDITLSFKSDERVKPTLTNVMMGKTTTAYLHMNRIPMEDLPDLENHQEQALRSLFIKKDMMRDSFEQTGDFFATSGVSRVAPIRIKPRNYVFYNALIWAIIALCPLVYFLMQLLFSGELFYIAMAFGILILFIVLLKKSMGVSESSKGSTYGAATASRVGAVP